MTESQKTQVIFVVGNRGAGKSTLAQLATSKPSFVQSIIHTLSGGKQKIQAASYQSKHTILVDTPGFDGIIHPDREFISKVTTWITKNHGSKGNDLTIAIVFLHQISERRFSDTSNPLQTICALAQTTAFQGRVSKIVFATSMWSNMQNEKSQMRAEEREIEFKEKWSVVKDTLGDAVEQNLMRFEKTSSSVERILQSVTH